MAHTMCVGGSNIIIIPIPKYIIDPYSTILYPKYNI